MAASGINSFAKEMAIRRRIGSIFNKREEDFPSLRDYNDYLEEVEDMTFNLIEGIDVPAIEEKIKKYQQENEEQIINARARKAEELAAALAASKQSGLIQNDTQNGVVTGQGVQTGFSTEGHYAPTVRPTGMAPQPLPVGGGMDFHAYAADDEEMTRLRAERGGRAGGWSVELSKKRAFEEAFGSIWVY